MLALKAAPMLLTTKGETVVQHKEIVEPEPLSLVATSRLITKDMDALKFEAAASLQILPLLSPGLFRSVDNHLVSSPYNSPTHLLDLNRLSLQDRIFALALTALRPIRKDYATAPYELSFNWEEVLGIVRGLATVIGFNWTSREFYTVIFRSLLKEDCERVYMTDLDSHSHEEAVVSGGLLKYWFGTCNKERRNLATCIWRHADDARAGGRGPWHRKARAAGGKLYDEIRFSCWKFTIMDGASNWTLEEIVR